MPSATPGNPDVAPADVNGAVVLVVDDDRAWRLVLETDLRILGYSPLLAADGAEALDRSAHQEPDAAIVDLMLPETDGLALVSELRARGRSLPTIFYSAYPISRTENQHPDVVACVSKAAAKADLYTLLPEAIRRKQRRQHSVAP